MSEQPRFFFCHLQKTAGTTLIRRIRGDFPERAVYPLPTDGGPIARVISVDNLLSVWAKRGDEIQVVTGHFPLCTAELLSGDFTTLTVLRHPLERTVSYMRHHRRRTPEDAHLTLEQVYDDEFRFHGLIHNHMTKMLSLLPAEMNDGALTRVSFTRERLERAKERLAGVDVVGLQENFESFCRELSERFGWSMADSLSPKPHAHEDMSPAFRERILEDNAHDIELYEFARRLVAERTPVTT
jgi:Sulfotransferase family